MTDSTSSKFPHFIRIFSATALWTSLFLLLLVNVYARANFTPSFWPRAVAVMSRPHQPDFHIGLATSYWQEGWLSAAMRELLVASEVAQTGERVLGASSPSLELSRQWEREANRVSDDYAFWQQVVQAKPYYRDGFIQLVSLGYQLGKLDEAKLYLTRAAELDPNNASIKQLEQLLVK